MAEENQIIIEEVPQSEPETEKDPEPTPPPKSQSPASQTSQPRVYGKSQTAKVAKSADEDHTLLYVAGVAALGFLFWKWNK